MAWGTPKARSLRRTGTEFARYTIPNAPSRPRGALPEAFEAGRHRPMDGTRKGPDIGRWPGCVRQGVLSADAALSPAYAKAVSQGPPPPGSRAMQQGALPASWRRPRPSRLTPGPCERTLRRRLRPRSGQAPEREARDQERRAGGLGPVRASGTRPYPVPLPLVPSRPFAAWLGSGPARPPAPLGLSRTRLLPEPSGRKRPRGRRRAPSAAD